MLSATIEGDRAAGVLGALDGARELSAEPASVSAIVPTRSGSVIVADNLGIAYKTFGIAEAGDVVWMTRASVGANRSTADEL